MPVKVNHQNGTVVEYKPVHYPPKYHALTFEIESAIYRGEVTEGMSVKDLAYVYPKGNNIRHSVYITRWVLKYLVANGVKIPESLRKEVSVHSGRVKGKRNESR